MIVLKSVLQGKLLFFYFGRCCSLDWWFLVILGIFLIKKEIAKDCILYDKMALKLSYGANDFKLFYTYYLNDSSYSELHSVISWWIVFEGANSNPLLDREVAGSMVFRRYNSVSLNSSKNVHIYWYSVFCSWPSSLYIASLCLGCFYPRYLLGCVPYYFGSLLKSWTSTSLFTSCVMCLFPYCLSSHLGCTLHESRGWFIQCINWESIKIPGP